MTTNEQKTKMEVKDAHDMDKRIPRDLIITYQGKPYITKAGLEWKATHLFGGNNFGVTTEIIERTKEYVLAKAIFTSNSGAIFSNYGEASKENVSNPMMHKHLLHLAVTRAENRVLRMATACGYVSVDEMDFSDKEIPLNEKDGEPATQDQKNALKTMKKEFSDNITFGEAKQLIGGAK